MKESIKATKSFMPYTFDHALFTTLCNGSFLLDYKSQMWDPVCLIVENVPRLRICRPVNAPILFEDVGVDDIESANLYKLRAQSINSPFLQIPNNWAFLGRLHEVLRKPNCLTYLEKNF